MKEDIYALTFQLEESYWWYVARRKIILSQIKRILEPQAKLGWRPRLLDYGCGTGLNLQCFSQYAEAYGVDTSDLAISFCRKRGIDRASVIHPDFPGEFEEPFDLVTMLDVLEHISDDRLTLRQVARTLKPSGGIFLTVPAYEFMWSGEDYVSNHVRRYTRQRLARTLHETGYKIIKLTYFNTFLFPAQASATFWKRLFQPKSMYVTQVASIPRRINSVLAAIMAAESGLLKKLNFPFGGSILCYARLL